MNRWMDTAQKLVYSLLSPTSLSSLVCSPSPHYLQACALSLSLTHWKRPTLLLLLPLLLDIRVNERLILFPLLNINLFHVRNTMIMLCLCRRICAKDTERRTLLAEAAHTLKVVRRRYAKRRADKNVPEMLDFCQEEGAFHFKGLC